MKNNKEMGALYGAFIGDAMALGPHWEYNTMKIAWKYKDYSTYPTTKRSLYHNKKEPGNQTHYGDQMNLILKYITEKDTFDLREYRDLWMDLFKDYPHYRDHATKDSQKIYESEDSVVGANSKDFAGPAMKLFMLVDERFTSEEILPILGVTHNYDQSSDHMNFFENMYKAVLDGKKPTEFIEAYDLPEDLRTYLDAAKGQLSKDAIKAVKKLGQSCSTRSAFPSVFYLLYKYEDNFEKAIVENIKCGGDQAARGMFLGFILGAYHGFDAIPEKWVQDLIFKPTLEKYIENKMK